MNTFIPVSCTKLQSNIQDLIKTGFASIATNQIQSKGNIKDNPDLPQVASSGDVFLLEDNFNSLLTSMILFVEQDPYSNVAMHLDVNFWKVCQENFDTEEEETIKTAIFEENGDSFQNSPMHLLFYEKITNTERNLRAKPVLTSMSRCRLEKHFDLNVDKLAYESQLLLVLQGVTAQFVTKEQYQHLLFILGWKVSSSVGNQPNYKEILTLFNSFPTNSYDNFEEMLDQLQMPFPVDRNKTLAENRCNFKDFFLA